MKEALKQQKQMHSLKPSSPLGKNIIDPIKEAHCAVAKGQATNSFTSWTRETENKANLCISA